METEVARKPPPEAECTASECLDGIFLDKGWFSDINNLPCLTKILSAAYILQ